MQVFDDCEDDAGSDDNDDDYVSADNDGQEAYQR